MFDRKKKASKFKGVYKCGRKWKSQIQADGVQHYLGVFDSEDAAASMYNQMASRLMNYKNEDTEENESVKKTTVHHLRIINDYAHMNSMSLVDTPSVVEAVKAESEFEDEKEHEVLELKLQLGRVIRSLTQLNQELMGDTLYSSPNANTATVITSATTTSNASSTTSSITESTTPQPLESQILSLLQEQRDLTDRIFEMMNEKSGDRMF